MLGAMSDTAPVKQQSTAAFYGQAVASFGVAMAAMTLGIYFLDADAWVRGFLAIGVLYLVTSCFTLAKVIRDRQEADGSSAGSTRPGWRRSSPTTTPSRSSDDPSRTGPKRLLRFAVWCASC